MLKKLMLIATAGLLVAGTISCAGSGQQEEEDPKKAILKEIESIERDIKMSEGKNQKAQVERLVEQYSAYANIDLNDSLAPEFLFKAANVCIGLEDYERSIRFFDRVVKHFPDYLKRPEAMYMAGFVSDYHMGKKGQAKERYEKLIEKYPNHIFAKEARLAIDALYMTDEELIQKFKEANEGKEEEEATS